jgi:hypothetical protein
MRSVRLTWKPRVTRKKRAAILKWIRRFYSTARDRGEYIELLAANKDTKFIWIFMLSNTFKEIE